MSEYDPCPVCGRDLVPGDSVNRHHLTPVSEGGKESFPIHKVCHSKIHSLWSEKELAKVYNNWESICADSRMQTFIKWVRKKHPEFRSKNIMSNDHKKRRRR